MSLIERLQQEEASAKAEAIQTYREILGRNSRPEPTDGKRLRAAMQVLNFTADRLAADLAVLEEAARLESTAASLPADLAERVAEAGRKWSAYTEETAKIAEQRAKRGDELLDDIRAIQRLDVAPRSARKALVALKRRHWMLFGEPAPIAE